MGYRSYKRSGSNGRRYKKTYTQPTREETATHPLIAGIVAIFRFLFRGRSARPNPSPPGRPIPGERFVPSKTNFDRRKSSGWEEAAARAAADPLPYKPQRHLLSSGERAFWYPLYHAVKGRYRIFCKVRLADIICCPPDRSDERRWFRKIGNYHVDFVICDPKTTAPLLVIELDDRTHRQPKGQARDRFKDTVLRAAGLPILRIQAQTTYDPIELAMKIDGQLAKRGN